MAKSYEFNVTPFKMFIPIIMARVPQFANVGGKRVDIHALVNNIIADGLINQADIALLIGAYFSAEATPKPPVVIVNPHPQPGPGTSPPNPADDDDVPDAPDGAPDGVALTGKVASIELSRIRAVLNGKRFPGQDPNVDPNSPTFNYATAVTFEAKLLDADGNILDTGKHGGTGHTKTTVYRCKGPDGSVAVIGPDDNAKSTKTIGAGGKNYVDTNGTNATFRFGFFNTPVDGDFEVTAEDEGVKSNVVVSRVS